ncbi:hypothetical protein BOX15_Mlig016072g1 [Macrostomum lignano]|uniref:EF-hand domain-containing protein n=1 Tax=Macrostomum lignano TaxID=282301 RepID=A0A267GRY8_9PLAT|nr:hypothetical protein BOX15_Mlig016072g1 [Macrostomum lignano]
MASVDAGPPLSLPSVSLNRRHLVFRFKPRTLYITSAVAVLFTALALASLYQRPALQAKAYVNFKRLVLGFGIAERLGVGDPNLEMVLNRKGLDVPSDDLAGRKPVSMPMSSEAVIGYIGESFFRLFRTVDSEDDDYLDPAEFGKLMDRLGPVKDFNPPMATSYRALEGGGANKEERMTRLYCEFDPLHLDTITKDLSAERGTNLHYLNALFNWTRPHRCPLDLPESLIIAGLRPPANQSIGRPYYVTRRPLDDSQSGVGIRDEFDYETAHSMNRYLPPSYSDSPGARAISALLSAFHPGAFASTRHPPHSSVALVRSVGPDHVEVAFRLHGEFQLARPPAYPFWFTPSFWFGHAVFSADFSRLLLLDMDLPADKNLNVDMEWVQAGMSGAPDELLVEVDIGYSSSMRLCTENACKLKPEAVGRYDHQLAAVAKPSEQPMSFDRAFSLLEVELYPFKRVPYLPFPEAFRRAKLAAKSDADDGKGSPRLVHSVVLWGSLDDQSC